MKWTKKKIAYSVLEFIFIAIVPITLIVTNFCNIQQTKEAQKFEISFVGIICLLIVFWFVKKIFIDRALNNANQQSNNLLSDLKVENDVAKIENIEKSLKSLRTLDFLARAVTPFAILVAVVLCFEALEKQLIALSGTLKFIALSFAVSTIFGLLNAREIVSKNRKEEVIKNES